MDKSSKRRYSQKQAGKVEGSWGLQASRGGGAVGTNVRVDKETDRGGFQEEDGQRTKRVEGMTMMNKG